MEKDLKMEVFASVDTVKPVEFHVYELHAQKIGNTYSIIRGAAWKLRNWNQAGVFEDGNKIYATEKLQEKIPNADFTVEYEGSRELPVLENRRIYQELIKYWITQKLSQILIFGKYRKYSCKSNVTSKWIMTNQGFETFSSGNREISLERKYNFWVATVYKGNIIKNLIMDCQSYTKYRPNETTGGIFVSWRRKEELPTGA